MGKIKNFFDHTLPNLHFLVFIVVLSYFVLRLCFFATSIALEIPPDEITHIELNLLYSQHDGLRLPDSAQTYHLGPVSRFPWFYHWLMGKLFSLNLFLLSPVLFFRGINILISLTAIIFSYNFFRLMTTDKWIPLLSVIVLTNIPMYSFLSAFVSYDNLANLFSAVSFYYLFNYLKNRQTKHLVIVVICSLLGSLTKHSYLPFLLIFTGIVMVDAWSQNKDFSSLKNFSLSTWTPVKAVTAVLICFLVGLNLNLYAVNFLKYKKTIPSCTQALTYEQCSEGKNFRVYDELWTQAKKIPKTEFLKPHDYFSHWKMILEEGILGILGHKLLYKTSTELLPYNILILLSLLFMIRRFKPQEHFINYSVMNCGLYAFILFYFVNYKTYLVTAYPPAGLQGRYLFAVITPLVFLFCYFLLNHPHRILRFILFIGVIIVFFWGDFFYFLKHADSSWYSPLTLFNVSVN